MGIGILERRQLRKQIDSKHRRFQEAHRQLADILDTSQQDDRAYYRALQASATEADTIQLDELWQALQTVYNKVTESVVEHTVFVDMSKGLFDGEQRINPKEQAERTVKNKAAAAHEYQQFSDMMETLDFSDVADIFYEASSRSEAILQLAPKITNGSVEEHQRINQTRHLYSDMYRHSVEGIERYALTPDWIVARIADWALEQDARRSHASEVKAFLQAQQRLEQLETYEALFTDASVTIQYLTDMTDTVVKAQSMLVDAIDIFRQSASRFDPEQVVEDSGERDLEELDRTGHQMTDMLGVMRGLSLEE